MANPELGAKQICPNCQTKFYDLGKRPAHCPKCDTEFDPEEALRFRRTRGRGAPPDYDREDAEDKVKEADTEDADADGLEEEVDTTPELDEEAAGVEPLEADDVDAEPGAPGPAEPDLGVGIEEDEDLEADADDVPFLEDDDEDFPDDDLEGLPDDGHDEP